MVIIVLNQLLQINKEIFNRSFWGTKLTDPSNSANLTAVLPLASYTNGFILKLDKDKNFSA
jgi:hypothetical protein